MTNAETKRVMIVHPVGDPQQIPCLRGISDFANECRRWVLQINPEMFVPGLRDLRGWPGDGVIAFLRTKGEVAAAKELGMPVVNLAGLIRHTGLPRVMVDHRAMGRLAAEHLLGCRLRRFAYCGEREMWYSQLRKEGFLSRLAQEGFDCSVFEWVTRFGRRNPWYQWMKPTEEWLRTLQPPVGLFAVRDYAGTVLIDACLRLGLRVPEDVAVIGVDNDLVTCEFCATPLSSVARSNREVGYQAAALLDRLMAGQAWPGEDILVPPEGVVQRRSTDVVVVEDPRIAAVVHYIHEHLNEPFSLDLLCEGQSLSRRSLDLGFKKYLGCAPREYICRIRVERSKRLLAAAERPKLQQIARACGFTGERNFRTVFQRLTGMTPSAYRLGLPDSSLRLG
jgi:LacI family transcriptional regulator